MVIKNIKQVAIFPINIRFCSLNNVSNKSDDNIKINIKFYAYRIIERLAYIKIQIYIKYMKKKINFKKLNLKKLTLIFTLLEA